MSVQLKELEYEGSNFLRQRLVLSCLSGRKIKIKNIRSNESKPGVRDYEVNLIRLFDQLSNGAKIEVGKTGTNFTFLPGILLGGSITHTCDPSRAIGYYLEPVMMLAPFCKRPLEIILKGITNSEDDISVDQLRYSQLEVLRKFLITDDGLKLVVHQRGLPPVPSGIVEFTCPVRRQLKAFQWFDSGLVKKVRGLCFSRRVNPSICTRIISSAKKYINEFLPDVYFVCDSARGPAPGFGIAINCVTTKGTYYSSDATSCQAAENVSDRDQVTIRSDTETHKIKSPEDLGEEAAFRLFDQIYRGGVVDTHSQCLVLLFMVLGPKDVSKVVLGPLSKQTIFMLRHLRDFFSVRFKIDEYKPEEFNLESSDEEEEDIKPEALSDAQPPTKRRKCSRQTGANKVLLTCVGTGFVNFSKGNI